MPSGESVILLAFQNVSVPGGGVCLALCPSRCSPALEERALVLVRHELVPVGGEEELWKRWLAGLAGR